MKRLISLIIAITIIIVITVIYSRIPSRKILDLIRINGTEISVEVVKSPRDIEKGLGGRSKLSDKEGMLFIMPSYDRHTFWMKDMKFPIDIIWIDKEVIVDISKNIPVEKRIPLSIYQPQKPVNFVLELNSGFSDKYRIRVGDKVSGLIRYMITL